MDSFLLVLIVIVLIATVVWSAIRNSASWKGKKGEKAVRNVLRRLSDEYNVLDDVVLKTAHGTTQIDHVVVSRYGVFAIETKNYRGEIFGRDQSEEWTQIIKTRVSYKRKWWKVYTYITKNKLYNPVKQSIGHAFAIKNLCPEFRNLYVVPIVVFTGRADLSGVTSDYDVVDIEDLLSTIKRYSDIRLADSVVNLILDRLIDSNVRESVSNRAHVRNLRKAEKERQKKLEQGICPRCGGKLVERSGRFGSFYGCSNYPKCKFTIDA